MDQAREPLDAAVQADDELINTLAAGLAVPPGRGDRGAANRDDVATMLAAWKAHAETEPIPEIDLDAAVNAALGSRRQARRPGGRRRHLVALGSAAALIVVAATGVSIAGHDTRPDDPLFAISEVLYPQEAASYRGLATVEECQQRAKAALAVGDKQAAQEEVAAAETAAASVLAEHGRGEVLEQLQRLEIKIQQTRPGTPNPVEGDERPPRSTQGTGESGGTNTEKPGGTATGHASSGTEESHGDGRGAPSPEGSALNPEPQRDGATREPRAGSETHGQQQDQGHGPGSGAGVGPAGS